MEDTDVGLKVTQGHLLCDTSTQSRCKSSVHVCVSGLKQRYRNTAVHVNYLFMWCIRKELQPPVGWCLQDNEAWHGVWFSSVYLQTALNKLLGEASQKGYRSFLMREMTQQLSNKTRISPDRFQSRTTDREYLWNQLLCCSLPIICSFFFFWFLS